jgi:hypothetical protein
MNKRQILLTGFLAGAALVYAVDTSWAQGLLVSASQSLRGTAAQAGESILKPADFSSADTPDVRRVFPFPPFLFRPAFTPSGRPIGPFGFPFGPHFPFSIR